MSYEYLIMKEKLKHSQSKHAKYNTSTEIKLSLVFNKFCCNVIKGRLSSNSKSRGKRKFKIQ